MKLRVEVDGEPLALELNANGFYQLGGEVEQSGWASVEEVGGGVFSVLLNDSSYKVHVTPHPDGLEVWVGLTRYVIAVADARDKGSEKNRSGAAGPIELRAQMPGKIIKLLAKVGAAVTAGQGLVVVEAMKMQNEVKAPKDGTLTRIYVAEGATVNAGEALAMVE